MNKPPMQQTVEVPTAEVTAKLATQVEVLTAKIAIIEQAIQAGVVEITEREYNAQRPVPEIEI